MGPYKWPYTATEACPDESAVLAADSGRLVCPRAAQRPRHLVVRRPLRRELLPHCADTSSHVSPPAWSTHTGLLAVALPSSTALPSLFADWFGSPEVPPQPTSTGPAIHLTHFSGADAATPRVRITLPVPVPPVSNAGTPDPAPARRISHLSFSPDSSFLVAIVRDPSSSTAVEGKGASDSITLYEQRGPCIDEWDCVAQEDAGRFTAQAGAPSSSQSKRKRVVSLRWVGEPRRVSAACSTLRARWPSSLAPARLAVVPCAHLPGPSSRRE